MTSDYSEPSPCVERDSHPLANLLCMRILDNASHSRTTAYKVSVASLPLFIMWERKHSVTLKKVIHKASLLCCSSLYDVFKAFVLLAALRS